MFLLARRTHAAALVRASFLCIAACIATTGSASGAEPPAETAAPAATDFKVDDKAREDVKTMPQEMIRVIEAKQYKIAVEQFFDPEFIKRQVERAGGIDAFVKQFEQQAAGYLRFLKATKGLEPHMNGSDRATYDLKGAIENKGRSEPAVPLKKIGKYWVIGI